ncbi:MAG: hypothetical protein HKP48_08295 [Winogradskyella sp.]|uniref:hypothetical protein n=1 Tax=Winogradskyella sp. TaxID=1883156 RepID=UPI00182EAA40|nr:hypothetical protein [Winogradskyella sp.]MBT8244934.1 hypothetical protein [Winogradskyella sp.]NNK23274.1 hypothetical protein [Winogradskyella sp.]
MCNWVVLNNTENPFRLFVYLKLSYPLGKITWNTYNIDCASLTLCNTTKTIKSNFKRLIKLKWLYYDEEFQYYRLLSLEKIRQDYDWVSRRAYPFTYNDLNHIRATLGAIIYTQPYKTYCRKFFKRSSNVLKSRSANESIAFSCDIKRYAEVSVLSIHKFYGITICKAVRLKQQAEKFGLIEVKKQYIKLKKDQVYVAKKGNEYLGFSQNVVYINGDHYFQQIDKIYTDLYFKRRKKLETL